MKETRIITITLDVADAIKMMTAVQMMADQWRDRRDKADTKEKRAAAEDSRKEWNEVSERLLKEVRIAGAMGKIVSIPPFYPG